MREQTGDERSAHRGEKGILAAPWPGRPRRGGLVVNPRHRAAEMQFGLGMGDIDPAEDIEAGDIRLAAILAGNADRVGRIKWFG